MTSLAGCSGESFASILRSLGYVSEQRKGPAISVPLETGAAAGPQATLDTELAPAPSCGVDAPPVLDVGEPHLEAQVGAGRLAEAAVLVPEAVPPPCGSAPLNAPEEAAGGLVTSEALHSQPDATGPANSEAAAVEEPLIEIWRPHRQQHPRRPEARSRKKPFERRERTPAAVCAAAPETAVQDAPPRETVAGEPPLDSAGTGVTARARDQIVSPPTAFKGRHKPIGERSGSEQKPRFGGHRGRGHEGEHKRPGTGEQGERRGERFGAREKRPSERPPDPDSPFAKLLVLKAQLEEKTRREKDNQEG